jgi:hypothetical protein
MAKKMIFVDYSTVEACGNPDTWDGLCMKCGDCGRKFTNDGILIDEDSETIQVELLKRRGVFEDDN